MEFRKIDPWSGGTDVEGRFPGFCRKDCLRARSWLGFSCTLLPSISAGTLSTAVDRDCGSSDVLKMDVDTWGDRCEYFKNTLTKIWIRKWQVSLQLLLFMHMHIYVGEKRIIALVFRKNANFFPPKIVENR
jgi:hypothetical protein